MDNNEVQLSIAILSNAEMKAFEDEVKKWWKDAEDSLEMDEMYRALNY